ncbi:MAG: pilus assembly protein [Legionella sp.]
MKQGSGKYGQFQLKTRVAIAVTFFLTGLLIQRLIYAAPLPLSIPQVPITITSPVFPQVLILLGNSQSMDGTMSGAIMTGSGYWGRAQSPLTSSSSPATFDVPPGFKPPLVAADASGKAPYTVNSSGVLYDNGPSRLNSAKAAIKGILNAYMSSTDFALATYNTSSISLNSTMVYYMSEQGKIFSFTNTKMPGKQYADNPCYQYTMSPQPVLNNCRSLVNLNLYSFEQLQNNRFMLVESSSDDTDINDVLYLSSLPSDLGLFLTYSTPSLNPSPLSPYPPYYTLAQYNQGNIRISYNRTTSSRYNSFTTSPTNAGYVPYSPHVLYAQRGFGYMGSASANSAKMVVGMTSAGLFPTTALVDSAISQFTPYLNPESNSISTPEIKAVATQSPIAGLVMQANKYLPSLGITSGNCPQKKYVILISDGLPTQDLSGRFWPPLGSSAALGYGVTATFKADGSLDSTNNMALLDAINQIVLLKNSGILTYVVGVGAGVDPSLNPQAAAILTAMAVAGGTGDYFPATSPEALVGSLSSILLAIQNGSFYTSAAAVNSTQINNNTIEYQAGYTSSTLPYLDWTGDISAIRLDAITGMPTTNIVWTAQSLLNSLVKGLGWQNTRDIATWNPMIAKGVPFSWTSISAAQQALLQPNDTLGSKRIEYLRGNTALEQRNGGLFRNRTYILGDIVSSQGVYVAAPNMPYMSSSYNSYMASQQNRQPMLYVGANDGMLHAFNASNGNEAFSFIPNGVFNNLVNLTATSYNQAHLFYVDGSPQSGDVQFSDLTWHTLVVGGENAGGKSIYAIDVTNPAAITSDANLAANILWEFTDSDMGLTFSQPQIARIASTSTSSFTSAVFIGNGYNSATNKAILYVLNPQTGGIIRKIDLCASVSGACNTDLSQGLSSVTTANSHGLAGEAITHVYAGDLQGNLWSVDVSKNNPADWTVRLLFQARNSSGTIQPITTAPVVTLNPNYPKNQGLFVIFGTGQLLTKNDLLNSNTQTIYGIWDKPNTMGRFSRSNLQQQTLSLVTPLNSGLSQTILTSTSNPINWTNMVGWFSDLPQAGQRVVTTPALVNGAFVTTLNTPPLATCGGTFYSMLLEVDYATGGGFSQPLIGTIQNGQFSSVGQYNGNNAVGVGLSNNYASSPNILGPNSYKHTVIVVTQANGTQSTVVNPPPSQNLTGGAQRTVGWWQIQ